MIAQLLLAVLAMVMFGLVFWTGKTRLASLAGYVLVSVGVLGEQGRHRHRSWLTSLVIATALAVAICSWAWVTSVNLNVDYAVIALIGILAIAALVMTTVSIHNGVARGSTRNSSIALILSGWTNVARRSVSLWRMPSAILDTRGRDLVNGRFSVITFSRSVAVMVARSTAALLVIGFAASRTSVT